jgi:ATP-binding protein involved in chromosome partitioning
MSKQNNLLINQLIQLLNTLKDHNTQKPLTAGLLPQINIIHQQVFIVLSIENDKQEDQQFLQHEVTKAAEILVKQHDPHLSVAVVLTNEKPVAFKQAIAVASGKGGVGKSTTAIGLAYALKDKGYKVGFLDADIYGPSLPILLGEHTKPQVNAQNLIIPIEQDEIQFISMGFLLDQDAPIIWRGPMASQAIQQFLKGVAWNQLDVLVIDLPPGTGDIQLTLIQKTALAGAVIVSTPQNMALIDARKAIAMFNKVQIPILGIVENMSHFQCPHCQEHSNVFEHGGAQKLAQELDVPFLAEIPLDIDIRRYCDEGQPDKLIAALKGKPYQALAEKLIEQLTRDHLPKSA